VAGVEQMKNLGSVLPARLDTKGVIAAYARIAPVYDLWGRWTESRAQDLCLQWLDLADVNRVLDVATGTGALLEKVIAASPGVTGIGADLSPHMLRRAAARFRSERHRYSLITADARQLPIRSDSIDLVLNGYMFDLLPETEFAAVLAEFSRVLSSGGRLGLINMTVPDKVIERVWETLYRIHPAWLGGCRGVRMAEHVAAAGFEVQHRGRVTQLAFPSEVLVARKSDRPAGSESLPRKRPARL
jgi:ubiquinone/menaquinone biosynthesis C-methylase UbiE